MLERRKIQRGKTFLGGSIEFGYPGFTIDCLVRDMSLSGAKVIFSGAISVPNEVDLVIAQKGKTLRARFVWRRDKEAGVAFLDAEIKSGVISLAAARQRKMAERDRERLQSRIAEVTVDR